MVDGLSQAHKLVRLVTATLEAVEELSDIVLANPLGMGYRLLQSNSNLAASCLVWGV